MKAVVPAAGSDFVSPSGELKATRLLDGQPLLRSVLLSRPWSALLQPSDYVFVFQDLPQVREFAETTLQEWFPGCGALFLPGPTEGAALTAAAGVSMMNPGMDGPIVIDLADIRYQSRLDPPARFANASLGALALTFESDDPAYSYIRTDNRGAFVEAREKVVISRNASAGTYFFADPETYFSALAHSIAHREQHAYRGALYVCPLLNGVSAQNRVVAIESVGDVRDIKLMPLDGLV